MTTRIRYYLATWTRGSTWCQEPLHLVQYPSGTRLVEAGLNQVSGQNVADDGDDSVGGDGDVDDDDGDDIITMIGICQSHLLIIAVSAEFESSLAIVSQLGVTHPRTICRAGSNNYNPRKNIFWC